MRFRWACLLLLAVLLLLGTLLFRAIGFRSHQPSAKPAHIETFETAEMLDRFRGGLRIPTISRGDGLEFDDSAFSLFRDYLKANYPLIHSQLEIEVVSGHSLFFHWPGSDPALPALVLLAHQDVVPVDEGTQELWSHPPFGAVVADGFVWGRGTLDDKFSLFSLIEAVERLLFDGFLPKRSVYLVLGHDEEIGGRNGAARIAEIFASRDLAVGLVLDEGGAILETDIPGLDAPVAMVGVAEKGYLSLELEVEAPGGHSSAPPNQTAVGILASGIVQLEKNRFPTRLDGASRLFFEYGIGPESSLGFRMIYANLWLFDSLVRKTLESSSAGQSLLRTTTAPTIFKAGVKDNVLPARAQAVVNFRLLPGDSVEEVIEVVRRIVADDRIKISPVGSVFEASPPSDVDSPAWRTLSTTIRELFPGTVVAPYLVPGGNGRSLFSWTLRLCLPIYTPGADRKRPLSGARDR